MNATLRILHLEDDPLDAELVSATLEAGELNFVATRVDTREGFLRALEQDAFDLVLADYSLPSFDGASALELVRERRPDLPFIFISGALGEDLATESIRRGATDYVLKQRMDRLAPAVRRAVREAEDRAERKRAEEALQISQERLQLAVDSANIGTWRWDVDNDILEWSERCKAIFGLPPETDMSYARFLESLHPDDRERVEEAVRRSLTTRTRYDIEYRCIWPDGSLHWIAAKGHGYYDADGATLRMEGVAFDISERKSLEEQLAQAQKMESIGKLAGGIAHEFNNMLTAIIGYAELAAEELPPDSLVMSYLNYIQQSAERSATLTRQLLAFAGKQMVTERNVRLDEVASNMEMMLRHVLGAPIELTLRPSANTGEARVDPRQIEQVILNLALNARDAMPNGGKLLIETQRVTLDRTYARLHPETEPGEYALLAVTDTGTGIAESIRSKIFEPFFTTKEVGKGTGLGLATCYGIVKHFGGSIRVYSELGVGTTFKIYLPLVESTSMELPEPKASVAMPCGTETILIVEDEPQVRRIAARVLHDLGYAVLEAENGADALRLLQERAGKVDLALTDVVMPKMGGRELIDRVRALYPGIKALFMSGYTDGVISTVASIDTQCAFLQKPFTGMGLAHKVREILDATDDLQETG